MEDTSKPRARWGPAAIGVIIAALALLPFWFFVFAPQIRHDELLENGVRGRGRLLTVEETGTVINEVPELELVVELQRADGTLDTATTDFVPTRRSLHLFQDGAAVTVAYDPEDPAELTIVDLTTSPVQYVGTQPAAGTSPGAMPASADSLRRLADSLRVELERLRQEPRK